MLIVSMLMEATLVDHAFMDMSQFYLKIHRAHAVSSSLLQSLQTVLHTHCTIADCSDGNVRLTNNSIPSTDIGEGRVEICHDNVYGVVCANRWDSIDAGVVCRQLGYNFTGYGSTITLLVNSADACVYVP